MKFYAPIIITTKGKKFVVLEGGSSPLIGIVANENGYSGAVYQDGYNLGVTRYPGHAEPNLQQLKALLGDPVGWFFHPAGFLSCYGSRKNPATEPGTVSLDQLIQAVKKL